MGNQRTQDLTTDLSAVTATGAGSGYSGQPARTSWQILTSGGTATVLIQVSLDGSNWATAATVSGSSDTQSVTVDELWTYVRSNVTARSGSTVTTKFNAWV